MPLPASPGGASFSLDRYAHLLPSLGAEAATRIETLVNESKT
jgi:hypothetical protein